MSETYAEGSRRGMTTGGMMITAVSCLSALMLIAAFAYVTGIGQRHTAALAANEGKHLTVADAALTAEQARSSSLARLRSFDHRLQLADAAVQTEMTLVRTAVDAPRSPGPELA
jgi:hypothetical protein